MKKYQVFVDTVENEEDWKDDDLIDVKTFIVKANNKEDAAEIMEDTMVKEFPGLYYYIWEITDEDILS